MNADRSNYALISALYADKRRGLYSDIYFPIIKYAILMLYGEAESNQPYLTSQQVHDKIKDLFHIDIPTVVIAMTVMKIKEYRNGNIVLEPMAKGNNFRVISADYDEDDAAYTEKQKEFDMHIIEIEGTFKRFMETEGTYDDGVKFIDFMADNTEALLEYFDTKQEQVVEEKYTTIVFFLEYLSQTNKELYKVANQLFWSSIIAAFLQSERPEVKGENIRNTEYFLDTSIVMGLLKLSTGERESCSKEVCDLIRSAGGQLKVHPLTIEEIKAILVSVETKGPYAYSSIADAYTRDGHNTNSIAKIRLDIVNAIEKLGVSVFPTPTSREKNEAFVRYRGNDAIRQLCEMRLAGAENPYSTDNFREVHDIAMDDYVRERNKVRGAGGQTYFLTSNKELKDFCRDRHPNQDYMKSPGKVILELWMHSSKPSDISSSMLTETMARCLDLHRAKVRTKLHEVARYFNSTKEDVAPEVYNEFLRMLYRRAKSVVAAVEKTPADDPKEYLKTLQKAIKEDQTYYDSINSDINNINQELREEVAKEIEKVSMLSDESEKKSREIGGLQAKYEAMTDKKVRLERALDNKSKALEKSKSETESQRAAKQAMIELNRLYIKKDELRSELERINNKLGPLIRARKRSARSIFPWLLRLYGILAMLLPMTKIIYNELEQGRINVPLSYIITLAAFGSVCVVISYIMNMPKYADKRREKAIDRWEKDNPNYFELLKDKAAVEKELAFVSKQIENATSTASGDGTDEN